MARKLSVRFRVRVDLKRFRDEMLAIETDSLAADFCEPSERGHIDLEAPPFRRDRCKSVAHNANCARRTRNRADLRARPWGTLA